MWQGSLTNPNWELIFISHRNVWRTPKNVCVGGYIFIGFLKLQYSQQYSSKILKHLCLFPLPQCWFGYHSGLSASKYAWLNIGEGEGTFQGGKQCEVEISWLFQKIREKRCLFQRFVTSIVDYSVITCLRTEYIENIKLNKRQNDHQWYNSKIFFKKTNVEEELVNEIGNEIQIFGPR